MILQHLSEGDAISLFGRTGHIAYFGQSVAVIKYIDGEDISISQVELNHAYISGEMSLIRRPTYNPCHVKLDKQQEREVIRFEEYCSELNKEQKPCGAGVRERVIFEVAAKIGDLAPPSTSHLHKIYKQWLACQKNMTEVLFGKKRTRRPNISEEVFGLMDEAIKKHYLKKSKATILMAYKEFERAYLGRQYLSPCPSLSTFERRIKKLDRLNVILARFGKSAAREEARSANSKIKIKKILDLVSMDAAHFNVGLKNKLGQYIGMPSIYFVLDGYSRVILGYAIHVGKHSESSGCVIHTLRYAISKKTDPRYPFCGLPSTIIVDQGVAYVSEDTVRFFSGLEVNIVKTATRMGWGKPMIERFIGTVRTSFFSGLDGYLGKHDKKIYSDETVKKAAVYTLAEFRQAFSKFIHDYHNTPHTGLNGKTPAQVWAESARLYPPILVEDMPHTQLLRGIREEKQLKHGTGITCDYQAFNSTELQRLYHDLESSKRPGERSDIKVTIYRDPLDASAISVVNPKTNVLIEVPNTLGYDAEGYSFADLRRGRTAKTTAEEAPVFDGGVREEYSSNKRRTGPDVPLDDFDNPMDLNEVLSTPSKSVASNAIGYETRPQAPDEDDYVSVE
ncbi:hypothetical protein CXK94_22065 [Stutzerimonas stutzeri]|uniref:Integrase catalytic domain-containing protein n=1 Tax=Stutzerimonas stutzeri TaxID=316 RepID=A0A2N8SPT0_STUST|nr:DNA-binding domain-containing protein [Stutzerimonas stutzeri]MCQ4327579.1 DDE-type integrase/transposase/recombinase [Stutzerimonas stutzeri]PNG04491.1 hypothetical protein CXK94_22065 [Stutzerimonas stutzeri]